MAPRTPDEITAGIKDATAANAAYRLDLPVEDAQRVTTPTK